VLLTINNLLSNLSLMKGQTARISGVGSRYKIEPKKSRMSVGNILGGRETFKKETPGTPLEWDMIVQSGMPVRAASYFGKVAGLNNNELTRSLHLSSKTFRRRQKAGRLNEIESSNLYEHAKIFNMAIQTLGSSDKAQRWLKSSLKALGGKTPLELMNTAPGADEVQACLNRIEYGGYS